MKQTVMQYVTIAMMVIGAYLIGVYKTRSEMLASGVENTSTPATQQAAQKQGTPTVTEEQMKALVNNKNNIVLGNKNAKLIIAEFSDPSCPYCHVAGGKNPELIKQIDDSNKAAWINKNPDKDPMTAEARAQWQAFTSVEDGGSYVAAVPEIKKLVDSGEAKLVWMYTPGHGNGEMGTKALYCANEKGKFWQVNDLLMSSKGYDLLNNTVKNDKSQAKALAEFLAPAMKASEMQKCLESGKYDKRVTEDPATVATFGQFGTPTFIFGTSIFQGAQPYDKGMKTVVETALK